VLPRLSSLWLLIDCWTTATRAHARAGARHVQTDRETQKDNSMKQVVCHWRSMSFQAQTASVAAAPSMCRTACNLYDNDHDDDATVIRRRIRTRLSTVTQKNRTPVTFSNNAIILININELSSLYSDTSPETSCPFLDCLVDNGLLQMLLQLIHIFHRAFSRIKAV